MSKKKSSPNPVSRIVSLLLITAIAFIYFYSNPETTSQLKKNPQIQKLNGSVKGFSSSIDTTSIKTKLIDPPEILNKTKSMAVSAGIMDKDQKIEDITADLDKKIKDLPKDQAKQVVRNTCQQIINNIDSTY